MCSTPKSSGTSAPKVRVKSFYEEMGTEQRKRFTEVANRADERNAHRREINKRWEAKQSSLSSSTGRFSWLGKLFAAF